MPSFFPSSTVGPGERLCDHLPGVACYIPCSHPYWKPSLLSWRFLRL